MVTCGPSQPGLQEARGARVRVSSSEPCTLGAGPCLYLPLHTQVLKLHLHWDKEGHRGQTTAEARSGSGAVDPSVRGNEGFSPAADGLDSGCHTGHLGSDGHSTATSGVKTIKE